MVKTPLPGVTKTRLCPPLSETDAASLALCFVQDVVTAALTITPSVLIAFTPGNGRTVLKHSLPNNLLWFEQQGANLSERLNSAIAHASTWGLSPIIALGADSPTLPPSYIKSAYTALVDGKADVTLGPTADGGYYLVGVRKPTPQLFENVTWSSSETFAHTARNAGNLGLRLVTVEQWYDVDTFADLQSLADELRSNEDARRRAPATYRWLVAHNLLS